jgi:hypothetical protein
MLVASSFNCMESVERKKERGGFHTRSNIDSGNDIHLMVEDRDRKNEKGMSTRSSPAKRKTSLSITFSVIYFSVSFSPATMLPPLKGVRKSWKDILH